MAVDLEKDEVLSSAIEGIPKFAELITTVPDEKRSLALQAAHQRLSANCASARLCTTRC
jgi:hypothetical protein